MPIDRPGFPISEIWFDCWRDAFGDPSYDVWRAPDGARLHYLCETRTVAGLRLQVVRSATNQQTVRFDIATGEDGVDPHFAGDLLRETGADLLELDFLAPDARVLQALRADSRGLPHMVEMMARSPYVSCEGSFDDWLQTRSHRKNWLHKERRALGAAGMTSRLVTAPAEAAAVIDEVLAVDRGSWKSAVGGALQQRPEMVSFYEALLHAAAAAGALRLYLLYHQGRIVAFEYGLACDGVLYLLKKSYLSEHAQASPGLVLTLQILRDAFAEPALARYDLLGGTPRINPAKTALATGEELLYRARVFAPTPRGRIAYLAYQSGHRLKETARPLWLWYKTNFRTPRARPHGAGKA